MSNSSNQISNQKYGSVFKFQFFGEMFVSTSDRDAIKEILITKNYPKSPNFMKLIAFPLNYRSDYLKII